MIMIVKESAIEIIPKKVQAKPKWMTSEIHELIERIQRNKQAY